MPVPHKPYGPNATAWNEAVKNYREYFQEGPMFWNKAGLVPAFVTEHGMALLLRIVSNNTSVWQMLVEKNLNPAVLHPRPGRLNDNLAMHPLDSFFRSVVLVRSPETEDSLRLLASHGLDLNARHSSNPKFGPLPLALVSTNWMGMSVQSSPDPDIVSAIRMWERLGVRSEARNAKANTFLHEAVLRNNLSVLEAGLQARPDALSWEGEKHRTLAGFIERRIDQQKKALGKSEMENRLAVLLEKAHLEKELAAPVVPGPAPSRLRL